MRTTMAARIAALQDMTLADLRETYHEVFGEETRSRHKDFLRKGIAWRLQANEEGDLSERAKRRAAELSQRDAPRIQLPRPLRNAGCLPAATLDTRQRASVFPPRRPDAGTPGQSRRAIPRRAAEPRYGGCPPKRRAAPRRGTESSQTFGRDPARIHPGVSCVSGGVRYVYLLQSLPHPARRYVGSTSDLRRRLGEHNDGKSSHTAKFRPWRIVAAIAFQDDARADAFERYLKSGSGGAFARRHMW